LTIPRCNDYITYLSNIQYYEKYQNWSRGNCAYEYDFECPETNKCIWRSDICDNEDGCGDGSDEVHCDNYQNIISLSTYNETLCSTLGGSFYGYHNFTAGGGKFYGHHNFALAMLMPVILAMLFILPHWWNNEKKTTSSNKIFTFSLVLLQFYPQWKMLNVLYMGLWKKDAKWKEEKERLQRNIGSLEPIIESVPQVHILLCLVGMNPILITGKSFRVVGFDFYGAPLFFATFVTSIISASKGIASFLLDGPCKLVPKNGLFGGLGTMGFIFLWLNIIATLLGKGSVLAYSYTLYGGPLQYLQYKDYIYAIYWVCFYLLPQFILGLGVLIFSFGLKGTMKIIIKFPPIILTPMFSIWTIGPVMCTKYYLECICSGHQKLGNFLFPALQLL